MLSYFKSYYKHFRGWFITILIIVLFVVLSWKSDFEVEMLLYAPVLYVMGFLAYVKDQKNAEKETIKGFEIVPHIIITLLLIVENATSIKDIGFMFITIGLCLCGILITLILQKKTNMFPILARFLGCIPLIYPFVVLIF